MKHAAVVRNCIFSTSLLLVDSRTWAVHVDPGSAILLLGPCCDENGKGMRCALSARRMLLDIAPKRQTKADGNIRKKIFFFFKK